MPDPATLDDYTALYMAHSQPYGQGIETGQAFACPFCAAPDWMRTPILTVREEMAKEHTCEQCGRSAKTIVTGDADAISFELVQTGGDDPPDYLPPIRRV